MHKTRCLSGRALLFILPAAVPMWMPCGCHSLWKAGRAVSSAGWPGCREEQQLAQTPRIHPSPRACPLPPKHGHSGAEWTAHGHLSSQRWLGVSGQLGTSPSPAKPTVLQQLGPVILQAERKADSSELNLLPRTRAGDAGAAKAFPSSRMWSWKPTICLERL